MPKLLFSLVSITLNLADQKPQPPTAKGYPLRGEKTFGNRRRKAAAIFRMKWQFLLASIA
jgi:hypothetical protein